MPARKSSPARDAATAAGGGGEDDPVTTQLHRLYDQIAAEPLPIPLLALLNALMAKRG